MNYMTEYISDLLDGDTNKTIERAKIIFSKKWNEFMTRLRRMKYLREESDRLLQEGFRISAIYGRSLQVFNAYASKYRGRYIEHTQAAAEYEEEEHINLTPSIANDMIVKFFTKNDTLTKAYQSGKINQRQYYNKQYNIFFDTMYEAMDFYNVGGQLLLNNISDFIPQTNNAIVNYKMRELIQNEVNSFLATRK